MRYVIAIIIAGIFLIFPVTSLAQEYHDNEPEFFSLEKYRFTYSYFYKFQLIDLSSASLPQRRVGALAVKFVNGFDALREDNTDAAIVEFQKSIRLIPEYFHVDFITALTYEEKGDFKNAARSFKSYLEKLKKFHRGVYRLTQPLIEGSVNFDISSYEEADVLIGQRMAGYGIDMKTISASSYSLLFIFIYIGIVCVLLYSVTKIPRIKRIGYKIKAKLNPSKDAWICLYCGKENANINTRCYNCEKMP